MTKKLDVVVTLLPQARDAGYSEYRVHSQRRTLYVVRELLAPHHYYIARKVGRNYIPFDKPCTRGHSDVTHALWVAKHFAAKPGRINA